MVRDSTIHFAVFGITSSVLAWLVWEQYELRETTAGISPETWLPVWLLLAVTIGFLVAGLTERSKGA